MERDEEELFHEIVRATTNVPPERIAAALAKVRALLAPAPRKERGSKNRLEEGGQDRGE